MWVNRMQLIILLHKMLQSQSQSFAKKFHPTKPKMQLSSAMADDKQILQTIGQ